MNQKHNPHPIKFETATVSREHEEWVIHRRCLETWGYTEPLNDEMGLEMVWIPGGTFVMGAPEDEPESRKNERPQHEVTLQPFFMGRYTVTQAQWAIVVGYPQIEHQLKSHLSTKHKGDNRPAGYVNGDEATEFCQRLSAHSGRKYKLPSEAQWEYACRARTTTPFHFGEIITTEVANFDGSLTYNGSPKGELIRQTTDVGSYPANEWGLHDMHGNIFEWCEDDFHSYEDAPTDGRAKTYLNRTNVERVVRGGCYSWHPMFSRSAFRFHLDPHFPSRSPGFYLVGFRVVCIQGL